MDGPQTRLTTHHHYPFLVIHKARNMTWGEEEGRQKVGKSAGKLLQLSKWARKGQQSWRERSGQDITVLRTDCGAHRSAEHSNRWDVAAGSFEHTHSNATCLVFMHLVFVPSPYLNWAGPRMAHFWQTTQKLQEIIFEIRLQRFPLLSPLPSFTASLWRKAGAGIWAALVESPTWPGIARNLQPAPSKELNPANNQMSEHGNRFSSCHV